MEYIRALPSIHQLQRLAPPIFPKHDPLILKWQGALSAHTAATVAFQSQDAEGVKAKISSCGFGAFWYPRITRKITYGEVTGNLSTMLCSLGSAVGALGCGGLCLSDSSTATLTYKGLHWDPIVCAYINIYIHRLKVTYTIIIWKVHLPMYGVFGLSTIGIHELWSLPARNRQFRLEKGMVMVHRKGMAQSDHFNLQRSIL